MLRVRLTVGAYAVHQKILLLSLQSIIEASINIIHHMDLLVKGKRGPLRFWPDNKSLEQICKDISFLDRLEAHTAQKS